MKPFRHSADLEPVERVSEVFCGLVMVLTFTLVAGQDHPVGRQGMHALLRAALGCNVAWGIIDGFVYLLHQRYRHERLAGRDFYGALACFLLCVGCALPAVVPFLLFDRPKVALRVSNGILLASLFAVGAQWGKRTGSRRFTTGLAFLLLGAAMVGVAIAFGG